MSSSIGSIIIVAAILLLIGPKLMQRAVIASLLLYCFPKQAALALCIAGAAYYYIHIKRRK